MASFQGTDPLRELELLIKSRYPIIYLETWEEERAEELLSIVAKNLGKPLFLWTATKGLFRWGAQNAIYNTTQPLQVLTHISSTDLMAIYLLKDFHQYLEDPVVIRKLKDIASVFEKKDGCIILSSSVLKIPAELRKIAVHFELKLPSSEEIRKIILETIEELRHKTRIHIGIDADEFNQMADRLKGLTEQEAKRIVCQAVLRDNQLTKEDIPRILESKKQIIE
jgi:hypothetical protein